MFYFTSQLLDSYLVDQNLFPLKSEPLPWLSSPASKQLKSLVDIENTVKQVLCQLIFFQIPNVAGQAAASIYFWVG